MAKDSPRYLQSLPRLHQREKCHVGACTGDTARHRGKFEHPQNCPPAFAPDLAVRSTIFEPHLGQLGTESPVMLDFAGDSAVGTGVGATGKPKYGLINAATSLGA